MFVTEMPRIMCAEIPVDTKISRNYHCSVLTRRYTVWPNSALTLVSTRQCPTSVIIK